MIKEVNVTVIVNDIGRAVKFYAEVLGLRVKARYGDQFAQVEAPGTIIALHPASRNGPRQASQRASRLVSQWIIWTRRSAN